MSATLAATPIATATRKDKYGRSVLHFDYLCRTVVVVVKVPRRSEWIVNEWDVQGPEAVRYFDARAAAVAFAAERAEVAATPRRANVAAGLGNVAVAR